MDAESDEFDPANAAKAADELLTVFDANTTATYLVEDEETLATDETESTYADLQSAVDTYKSYGCEEPDPADYGVFIPSIPDLVSSGLEKANCADWLQGLIVDGIIAGVGAVLGFVPQMLVLFILLAILEYCGYLARVAFIMDRIFRKFGLSGKSFIPMLVGMGCGVPGIMASRTIENEKDRRMTIMTTTFIPCGAKVPFIAMIAGAIFNGSAIISTGAYFIGVITIICSGIILKKTKMFAGDTSPFVMDFRLTTGQRLALFYAACGSVAGPSSRRPVQSSFFLPSLYGLQHTSDGLTEASECFQRIRWITVSSLRSVTQSAGSSSHRAGATGRQRLQV